MTKDKWVIFDLDGTLADIETRRKMATKSNGKMDWDVFFADKLVELDDPNQPVIDTCKALSESGYNPIVLDNLSYGHKWAVKWGELIIGDISNRDLLVKIFKKNKINL